MTGEPSNDARIDGLFELAFRRHQSGQLQEAEQLYRSILEADPRQLDCLHFLGIIALQSGRAEQAVDLIGQAIAANDGIAAYHGSIAEAYRTLGKRPLAVEHYRKAVAIDPTYWAAHGMLADLLREDDDSAGAIAHYQKAVAAKPDFAAARHNLAMLLLDHGRADDALDEIWRAVAATDTEASRAQFVRCVRTADKLPGDPGFRHVMTRAFTEVWGRPAEFAGAALTLVKSHPAIGPTIRAVDEVWPRRVAPNAMAPATEALTQDPLVHCVLESTPVADQAMERLLACVRTLLIDAALESKDDITPEMVPFCCALARQCFINEYVFHVPDVERDGGVALRAKLMSELLGTKPILTIQLIAYACYAPLRTLDRDTAILSRTWPADVRRLIDQQVQEPQDEAKYRGATIKLSGITDETSARVREQSEDDPWPRWTFAPPINPASGIVAYLKDAFPLALPEEAEPEALDILIAGCGTGQQPIEAARRFPKGRVLAIDTSLANLAYAQRKATELGLTNIEFAQADIVAFKPDRMFDVIEANGVLHHLADPMKGWSSLLRLLKPGGFMRLGFYSEPARAGITAAREFALAGGYDATAESIRRCRQNLLKVHDPRLRTIFGSPDFYSIGGCRDLLFHVQEHGPALPQIAAFLTEHRLSFLGFELNEPALARYGARFPEDKAMTDLATWHLFESDNPDTFGGIYQFWVQKTA